jgi:hypothetical protein
MANIIPPPNPKRGDNEYARRDGQLYHAPPVTNYIIPPFHCGVPFRSDRAQLIEAALDALLQFEDHQHGAPHVERLRTTTRPTTSSGLARTTIKFPSRLPALSRRTSIREALRAAHQRYQQAHWNGSAGRGATIV